MSDLFDAPEGGPPPRRPSKSTESKSVSTSNAGSYSAADIEVLEGLEPVRRRPGMYIGGTDSNALHHLFAEVIDNSMDEAIAGHATRIEVHFGEDGYLTVSRQRPRHSGREPSEIPGPLDARNRHDDAACRRQVRRQGLRDLGRPARRRRLGGERAFGRSDHRGRSRPDALPADFFARQTHQQGRVTVGKVQNRRGTTQRFHPDPEIFGGKAEFSAARLFKMTRSKAYLFRWRGAALELRRKPRHRRGAGQGDFHFPGGLRDFLANKIEGEPRIVDDIFSGTSGKPGYARRLRMGGELEPRRRLPQLLLQHHPDGRWRHARGGPAGRPAPRPAHLCRTHQQQARRQC
jgi:topoisomerase-4 subunit B